MNAIEKKQAQRFLYLQRLYEKGCTELQPCGILDLGRELSWDDAITNEIEDYLKAEGLVDYPAFGQICITHRGVKEVERKLVSPNQSTQHFSSSVNIILVNGDFKVGGDVIGRDKTILNEK